MGGGVGGGGVGGPWDFYSSHPHLIFFNEHCRHISFLHALAVNFLIFLCTQVFFAKFFATTVKNVEEHSIYLNINEFRKSYQKYGHIKEISGFAQKIAFSKYYPKHCFKNSSVLKVETKDL
jgi:hypothetical protein